jgi:pimeloyl-ACP methyl ester carboxylesterase
MGEGLDTALAVLNGLVGDHLARTSNGLVTPMGLFVDGKSVDLAALPQGAAGVTRRVVVLVHGLMSTETVWRDAEGGDYGKDLAREAGFTPFYVRYNTGLAIAENGVALAAQLDALVAAYPVPVEELLLVGHSMGGLVIRSACHEGVAHERPFLRSVRSAIYVGTPHLGAPYERLGRVVSAVLHAVPDPYTRLIADIADLRSAGLQDLGDADLRHEDRARRSAGIRLADWRHPVPLLPQIKHHLVAGSLSDSPVLRALFGDAVVPVSSALAGTDTSTDPPYATLFLQGRSHIALAHDPEVGRQIVAWARGGA